MNPTSYANMSEHAVHGKHPTAYSHANATGVGPLSGGGRLESMLRCPVAHNKNSLTAGPHGPVMLQDTYLLEKVTQFAREKIPARVVHALGCGAAGTFTVTNDSTKYSRAKVFSEIGKKTPVAVRFSGTFTEQGESDTTRDLRGFACKFKTEEGIWDLMTINTPVFNCRDMKIGPDTVHACKRDPRTGYWNPAQIFDFTNFHPEGLHQLLMIWTDRTGTPTSFRKIHGWACNTYSLIDSQNKRRWVKFHLVSQQGTQGFNVQEAKLVGGEEPNFMQKDLYKAIEQGKFPKWKLMIQLMDEEEGYTNPIAFDPTKVWPHKQYPMIEVGMLELHQNPVDHFTEVEQIAFSPANIVPGISFSPDKLLQGRLLVLDDTQHHRLGANHKQIPINAPIGEPNSNYYCGGYGQSQTRPKYPHYSGSVYGGPQPDPSLVEPPMRVDGPVGYYDMPGEGTDEDYYGQCRLFWGVLSEADRKNLCFNLGCSLAKGPAEVGTLFLSHLMKVHPDLANGTKSVMEGKQQGTLPMTEAEKVIMNAMKSLGVDNGDTALSVKGGN